MAKSLDKVLQPDGTYKWELVEPSYSEKMGNAPGTVCPTPEPKKKEKLEVQKETTANFEKMTKAALETYGRTIGLELDKRHNKADLIAEIEKFTSNN
jgi:hypothetical protein